MKAVGEQYKTKYVRPWRMQIYIKFERIKLGK